MAAEIAGGLHDPLGRTPEEIIAALERQRAEELRRIREMEAEPPTSIYRQDEAYHRRLIGIKRADVDQITHSIWRIKVQAGLIEEASV